MLGLQTWSTALNNLITFSLIGWYVTRLPFLRRHDTHLFTRDKEPTADQSSLVNQWVSLELLTGIWMRGYLREQHRQQQNQSAPQHGWQLTNAGNLEHTALACWTPSSSDSVLSYWLSWSSLLHVSGSDLRVFFAAWLVWEWLCFSLWEVGA